MATVGSTFAATMAAQRKALAVRQTELARRTGLSQATLSLIERGKREPLISSAVAIAAALGFSLDDLTPNED